MLFFVYFGGSGCGLNSFFTAIHLVFSLLVCIMAVHPKIQENKPSSGLLQPAVVTLYCTYLVGAAMSGEPVSDEFSCNPFSGGGRGRRRRLRGR